MNETDIKRIQTVLTCLDEKQKRVYLFAEAKSLGGDSLSEISKITGISCDDIKAGEEDYNAVIAGTSDMIKKTRRNRKNILHSKDDIIDCETIEEVAKDGRLSEPSDGINYKIREAYLLCKQLNRPLTDEEMHAFHCSNQDVFGV